MRGLDKRAGRNYNKKPLEPDPRPGFPQTQVPPVVSRSFPEKKEAIVLEEKGIEGSADPVRQFYPLDLRVAFHRARRRHLRRHHRSFPGRTLHFRQRPAGRLHLGLQHAVPADRPDLPGQGVLLLHPALLRGLPAVLLPDDPRGPGLSAADGRHRAEHGLCRPHLRPGRRHRRPDRGLHRRSGRLCHDPQ